MHGLMHAVTGHVLASGCDGCNIIDWFKWLAGQVQTLLVVLVGVVITAGLVWVAVKVGRTLGGFVVALLLAGVVYWAVALGGYSVVGDMIGRIMPNSGVVSQLIKPAPATSPTASPTP